MTKRQKMRKFQELFPFVPETRSLDFVTLFHSIHQSIGNLDLGHGGNIHGLNVVLEFLNLFAKLVDGNLFVLDDAHHLKKIQSTHVTSTSRPSTVKWLPGAC